MVIVKTERTVRLQIRNISRKSEEKRKKKSETCVFAIYFFFCEWGPSQETLKRPERNQREREGKWIGVLCPRTRCDDDEDDISGLTSLRQTWSRR